MNRKELEPEKSPRAEFGDRLRRLRDEHGWTQAELGRRMGYSDTHISAVETGRRSPTSRFAQRADYTFDTGDQFKRRSEAVHGAALLDGFPEYVPHEMRAIEIRLYNLGIMPGLLQTPDYAAAITAGAVRRGAITEQQAGERLTLLAERQACTTRTPRPLMFVILDESCLLRPVGGPKVMAQQFDRLLEFAASPSTVLQVAPFSLAEHRSFDLPVNLLTLPDRSHLAYAESAQRGHLVRESSFVVSAFTAYHQLQAESLSQTASVAMIEQLRKGTP